jgi:hypothetical protein
MGAPRSRLDTGKLCLPTSNVDLHRTAPHRTAQLDRKFPAYYHLRAARLASPCGPKLFLTLPERPNWR